MGRWIRFASFKRMRLCRKFAKILRCSEAGFIADGIMLSFVKTIGTTYGTTNATRDSGHYEN
jgi:hypothetical protein